MASESHDDGAALKDIALAALILVQACAGCGGSSPATTTPSCAPTAETTGSPSSIADVVGLANALLKTRDQVTLPCFVESLDRPLGTLATNSIFSAQPAAGKRSPRIFLFSNDLVMSVVPAGIAANLLELADYTSPIRSIKGEILFPLSAPLSPAQPYERILTEGGTACGGCHDPEAPAPQVSIATAFESDVLRPRTQELVTPAFIESETAACDPTSEPARCALLTAVYGHGAVVERSFSPNARTIFRD